MYWDSDDSSRGKDGVNSRGLTRGRIAQATCKVKSQDMVTGQELKNHEEIIVPLNVELKSKDMLLEEANEANSMNVDNMVQRVGQMVQFEKLKMCSSGAQQRDACLGPIVGLAFAGHSAFENGPSKDIELGLITRDVQGLSGERLLQRCGANALGLYQINDSMIDKHFHDPMLGLDSPRGSNSIHVDGQVQSDGVMGRNVDGVKHGGGAQFGDTSLAEMGVWERDKWVLRFQLKAIKTVLLRLRTMTILTSSTNHKVALIITQHSTWPPRDNHSSLLPGQWWQSKDHSSPLNISGFRTHSTQFNKA
ncbi:hypothetical protein RJT34_25102 [Clitoria ternatea]|uniref:Uncharacterized protein n=1 Tax=Clitoria ternatea TaxID=43366 RepID=A0AAN9FPF7_CLITE